MPPTRPVDSGPPWDRPKGGEAAPRRNRLSDRQGDDAPEAAPHRIVIHLRHLPWKRQPTLLESCTKEVNVRRTGNQATKDLEKLHHTGTPLESSHGWNSGISSRTGWRTGLRKCRGSQPPASHKAPDQAVLMHGSPPRATPGGGGSGTPLESPLGRADALACVSAEAANHSPVTKPPTRPCCDPREGGRCMLTHRF